MDTDSQASLKEPVVTLLKVGYYEITSIIVLSGLFWLFVAPLFTIGAALLALFDVIEGIYENSVPRTERGRIRYFVSSFRANIRRGLPLSAIILFIFANTAWYFAIVSSGRARYYVVGGLAGIYACLLVVLFSLRVAYIAVHSDADWRTAARRAGLSWTSNGSFTALQILITTFGILASIAFPISLLLLPSGLALLELVFYLETTGTDPRTVLARYQQRI